MTIDAANQCLDDLRAKLSTVPLIKDKIFEVYHAEEMMDKTHAVKFPALGIVYDGIQSISETNKDTGKQGYSAEIVFSLIMFFSQTGAGEPRDAKRAAVIFLDQLRAAIIGTRSPTGHKWRFVMEGPATDKGGVIAYGQRWASPIQLT